MKTLKKLAERPHPQLTTLESVCAICQLRKNSVAARMVANWIDRGAEGKIHYRVQHGVGRMTSYQDYYYDVVVALTQLGVPARNRSLGNDRPRGGAMGGYVHVAKGEPQCKNA